MDEYEVRDVVLSDKGATALDGDLSEYTPEEALIMRFFWSRELMELPPPTEEELENLIDLYHRAVTDKMLCDMLIRGELMVNSIIGQTTEFLWKASAKGRERFARELGEGYDA